MACVAFASQRSPTTDAYNLVLFSSLGTLSVESALALSELNSLWDATVSGVVKFPLTQINTVIDEEVFSLLLGLATEQNPRFVHDLLELFLVRSDEGLGRIGASLATGDLEAVYRDSHSLKTSSGMLGALKLQALLSELNEAAEAGRAAAAERLYTEVVAEHVRAREVLSRWLTGS